MSSNQLQKKKSTDHFQLLEKIWKLFLQLNNI